MRARTRALPVGQIGLALLMGGCAQLAGLSEDYYEAEGVTEAGVTGDATLDGDAPVDGDASVDGDGPEEAADADAGICADGGSGGLGTCVFRSIRMAIPK